VKYKMTTWLFAKRFFSFRFMAITDEMWEVGEIWYKHRLLAYIHIKNGIYNLGDIAQTSGYIRQILSVQIQYVPSSSVN
jgi:hypothetical protein